MNFPALSKKALLQKIAEINPEKYARTRNFHNGNVTRLSPYVSRGVLSTSEIFDHLQKQNYRAEQCESLVKELCWRDYFQLVWEHKGEEMFQDMNRRQPMADRKGIPVNMTEANTGIEAIDKALQQFYKDGYLHNHMRMYIAMLACNLARCHWSIPAKWMYYHLLDADAASNTCSWQWVSGAFSNKCYYANQENINRYFGTHQRNSYLDTSYDAIEKMSVPKILNEIFEPQFITALPQNNTPILKPELPVLVYNFYNLDPEWHKDLPANRILLLEPEFFRIHPSSDLVLDFILRQSKEIPDIQIMSDSFESLQAICGRMPIQFKQHPTTRHYRGKAESVKKIFPEASGYFSSFSKYWKQAEPAFYRAFRG
jgi:deoxyribodipyrimidine photo-lyase